MEGKHTGRLSQTSLAVRSPGNVRRRPGAHRYCRAELPEPAPRSPAQGSVSSLPKAAEEGRVAT